MEYSIHQLSRLSGVTARTLRWYHKVGLLTPSRVAESGYRFYGQKEVDRLQDILYYRALGVELERIRECLDDPGFDRRTALLGHLLRLREEKARLEKLIRSVEDTIEHEEREMKMNDEAKFEAFRKKTAEENETAYGREAREKYGDGPVDESKAAMMGLSREEYERWAALGEEILSRLEKAVEKGLSPESEAGREIAGLHRRWLRVTVRDCGPAQHRGIAELYVADGRFKTYYDRKIPGCARFLRDAVMRWAG